MKRFSAIVVKRLEATRRELMECRKSVPGRLNGGEILNPAKIVQQPAITV
jgi:hypothetical protein